MPNGMSFEKYDETQRKREMTLVPIIYTSLIIFATLLTSVIIFSYIAFRIKGGNKIRQNSIEENYAYIPKPVLANPAPTFNRAISQREVKPFKTEYYQSNSLNTTCINPTHANVKAVARKSTKYVQNVNHQSMTQAKPVRIPDQKDRLEIMNNSERYRRTSEFDDLPIQTNGSLSDSNLLNFYSDKADQEFSVMNANYLRKAL